MKTCAKCGTVLENQKFCPECGEKVPQSEPVVYAEAPVQHAKPCQEAPKGKTGAMVRLVLSARSLIWKSILPRNRQFMNGIKKASKDCR